MRTWSSLRRPNWVRKHSGHSIDRPLDVPLRRSPIQHADSHRTFASPFREGEIRLASLYDFSNDMIGAAAVIALRCMRRGIQKSHQALIDYGFPQDLRIGQGADARGQRPSVPATSVDQISRSSPTQLAKRRISCKAARPS